MCALNEQAYNAANIFNHGLRECSTRPNESEGVYWHELQISGNNIQLHIVACHSKLNLKDL